MTLDELTAFVAATRNTLFKAMDTSDPRYVNLELAKAVHIIAMHLHQLKRDNPDPEEE